MAIWDKTHHAKQKRPHQRGVSKTKKKISSNGKSLIENDDEEEKSEKESDDVQSSDNNMMSDSCEITVDNKTDNVRMTIESKKKPSVLVQLLSKISKITYPAKNKPLFTHENTEAAAAHNTKILEDHDWDMEKAVNAVNNTILEPGSEFRPIVDLEEIFKHHEDWSKFKVIATEGVKYKFDESMEYDEKTRLADVKHQLKVGNNKSATTEEMAPIIQKNYTKEVERGWMTPFLKSSVENIKKISIIPIGNAKQWTIDMWSNRVIKNRTTHDMSKKFKSGQSWNGMIDDDQLEPCLFATCLLRYLHRMHDIRLRNPETPIFQGKTDLDSAFRRIHVYIWHSLLATTIVNAIAYILSRLPFGVSEGPGQHDIPSNMIVDLAQQILDDPTWDPSILHSPHHDKIPMPERLPDNIPFGEAHALSVKMERPTDAYIDGYVDDLMALLLDSGNLSERGRQVVALAIHIFFRPVNENDPLPREDVLSLRKLLGEGKLEEVKVILGWMVDSRRFTIKLTEDKANAWIKDLDEIIKLTKERKAIGVKTWQSMNGKCNTAAYIHREMRFFLSKMTFCQRLSVQRGGSAIAPLAVLPQLELWKKALTRLSTIGRSINHITFTLPHMFTKQDASKKGLGGFNCTGLGWRFIIPPALENLLHINILEFMAVVITIWLTILAMDIKDRGNGMKILAQTDNTSALGWLKASSKYNKSDRVASAIKEAIGQKLAELLMDADLSIYSQHIPGKDNFIADKLSRDTHETNIEQLSSIQKQWPELAPDNLRIVDLPPQIISWIQSLWEKSIQMQVLPEGTRKKLMEASKNGPNLQPVADWTFTSEITTYAKSSRSSVASRTVSDITLLAKRIEMNLEDNQFAPKSSLYLRPFDRLDMKTLSETQVDQ